MSFARMPKELAARSIHVRSSSSIELAGVQCMTPRKLRRRRRPAHMGHADSGTRDLHSQPPVAAVWRQASLLPWYIAAVNLRPRSVDPGIQPRPGSRRPTPVRTMHVRRRTRECTAPRGAGPAGGSRPFSLFAFSLGGLTARSPQPPRQQGIPRRPGSLGSAYRCCNPQPLQLLLLLPACNRSCSTRFGSSRCLYELLASFFFCPLRPSFRSSAAWRSCPGTEHSVELRK